MEVLHPWRHLLEEALGTLEELLAVEEGVAAVPPPLLRPPEGGAMDCWDTITSQNHKMRAGNGDLSMGQG